jgi:hypothetical protein
LAAVFSENRLSEKNTAPSSRRGTAGFFYAKFLFKLLSAGRKLFFLESGGLGRQPFRPPEAAFLKAPRSLFFGSGSFQRRPPGVPGSRTLWPAESFNYIILFHFQADGFWGRCQNGLFPAARPGLPSGIRSSLRSGPAEPGDLFPGRFFARQPRPRPAPLVFDQIFGLEPLICSKN